MVAVKANKRACTLRITEAARIRRRLTGQLNGQASVVGFVCSEPWAWECVKALESGRVQIRKKLNGLEQDLHKKRVYPPAGPDTSMIENPRTLRWMPPDYTGSPLDEREDTMSLVDGCRLPASVSAQMIARIRHQKSRPERIRVKTIRR